VAVTVSNKTNPIDQVLISLLNFFVFVFIKKLLLSRKIVFGFFVLKKAIPFLIVCESSILHVVLNEKCCFVDLYSFFNISKTDFFTAQHFILTLVKHEYYYFQYFFCMRLSIYFLNN